MKRCVCIGLLMLVLASGNLAQADPPAKAGAKQPTSLPKYLTPEEALLPLPKPSAERDAPTGTVYCPAEYELNEGLLIAWEGYTDILEEMTVLITTNDPAAIVYVMVDSSSEESSVYSQLSGAGADMGQVDFVVRTTDTVWIRDYGPRYIHEDGVRAIIDHTYNRPRPSDNALSDYLSTLWSEAEYDIPLTHGGGNFHLFSNGEGFMTDLILDENSSLSEQDVKDYYLEYQNLDVTIYPGFPTSFDSTQHIDMWMLPVGDDKIIIGEYSPSTGQPYTITEDAVTDLESRGYTVYRTPGWNSGGTHYTYTNAVIMNDQVFVPKFNHANDSTALSVFQTAMPGYTFHQIDCSGIIHAAGALHCIVMHRPEHQLGPDPVVNVQTPNGGEVWTIGEEYDIEWSAYDDVAVTSIDIHLSTDSGTSFPHEIATGLANTGVYTWEVTGPAAELCRIRVTAHDGDANTGEDISNGDFTITAFGPQVIYDFPMDSNPGWTTEGDWDFGQPTGQGGDHGGPDPNSAHTGLNVYGYNLNGDYGANLDELHLTSTALDCSGVTDVKLAFWRWLGVESPTYDHAYVRVSNGGGYQTIWENTVEVTDSAWVYQEFDISSIADDQATVYLRWTMGVTDGSWFYCGWNIDDVQIIGIPSQQLGDLNCDGSLNSLDIDPFVLALTATPPDYPEYYAAYPDCEVMLADCDNDGSINSLDIDPFVSLLTGS